MLCFSFSDCNFDTLTFCQQPIHIQLLAFYSYEERRKKVGLKIFKKKSRTKVGKQNEKIGINRNICGILKFVAV